LEPELLIVFALATEGLLSSVEKPMLSSLPLPGRNPGDNWAMSSLESLKKLPNTLEGMTEPLPEDQEGGVGEVAVGGFFEIDGILAPDVSKTASSLR
jgi:hypothetical protein